MSPKIFSPNFVTYMYYVKTLKNVRKTFLIVLRKYSFFPVLPLYDNIKFFFYLITKISISP